jgi:hypothetical protein
MDGEDRTYLVRLGERSFSNLTAAEALAVARDLIAQGEDPFLYDRFGDPMSLTDLEMVARA